MGSMEMLPMIAPFANYYLASEDLEPGHGWNYHYLDRLADNNYISPLDITAVLWEGFFEGDQVPVTLGVMDLSKTAGFVAAVEQLSSLLVRELSTPGVVLGFLQAADAAYRMGSEFVDFGHFIQLLLERLPSSGYVSTSRDALSDAVSAVQDAQRVMFVHERHSDDVPHATGLNVYLPDTDSSWSKRSKLFYQLYGYKNWTFLVGYIYGMRSGDITDSFVASDLLSWKNAPALVETGATAVSVTRSLMEGSLKYAVSSTLRYGMQAGEDTIWVGQAPAVIDAATGVVSGSWNWKLLTLTDGHRHCAVYHERSGSTMIFQVHFYKYGRLVQRAFGVFSIETGHWSLYANKTTGSAEIQVMRRMPPPSPIATWCTMSGHGRWMGRKRGLSRSCKTPMGGWSKRGRWSAGTACTTRRAPSPLLRPPFLDIHGGLPSVLCAGVAGLKCRLWLWSMARSS